MASDDEDVPGLFIFNFLSLFQNFPQLLNSRQGMMKVGVKMCITISDFVSRCCRFWRGVYVWQKPFLGQQVLDSR